MADSLTVQILDEARLEAQRFAEFASLPFHQQKWRGSAGEMAGSGVGSSVDFHDQRLYAPGDDPRHINWQAFARSGDYQMKLYREEVRPELILLLDASASMTAYPAKARRFAELLYFALASSAKVGAHVQTFLVGGDDFRLLDPSALETHSWLDEFHQLAAKSQTAPAIGAFPLRPKSMRLFISDLLYPADPEEILKPLNHQSAHTMVIAPQAKEESDPDWAGNYQFHDPETGRDTPMNIAPEARQRYLDAYRDHLGNWQRACTRQRCTFVTAPAAEPLEALASSF